MMDIEKEMDKLQDENAALRKELERWQNRACDMEAERDEERSRAERAEDECETLRAELARWQTEYDPRTARVIRLEGMGGANDALAQTVKELRAWQAAVPVAAIKTMVDAPMALIEAPGAWSKVAAWVVGLDGAT